jgi:capsular polysaccharide biosynthesis protein
MDTKPLFIAARYKYLLLLPFLLIIPVTLVMSAMSRSTSYVSVSRVLVQGTRFGTLDVNGDCNPYISTSQCISNKLNTLLSTDQFAAQVADKAGLPTATEYDRASSVFIVRNGTSVYSGGDNLVVISHSASTAAEAQQITKALVDTYDLRYVEIAERDAANATSFYEAQLEDAGNSQFQANQALQEYLSQHPGISTSDPQFTALSADVQAANKSVQDNQSQLNQIQAFLDRLKINRESIWDVVDEAGPGAQVTTGLKKLMVFPIAGFLLALSISAGLFAFLMKTDRSVRVAEDLAAIPGLTVLGTMPDVGHARKRDWPKQFFRLAITTFGTPERPVRAEERQGGA